MGEELIVCKQCGTGYPKDGYPLPASNARKGVCKCCINAATRERRAEARKKCNKEIPEALDALSVSSAYRLWKWPAEARGYW